MLEKWMGCLITASWVICTGHSRDLDDEVGIFGIAGGPFMPWVYTLLVDTLGIYFEGSPRPGEWLLNTLTWHLGIVILCGWTRGWGVQ
ncbi:hypothetical protein BKA60DRAFT_563233 [Fusarium oxysporum]|nr:hypothetical protein BKA60DRAFT_563233 [Fusarium oxysporum]